MAAEQKGGQGWGILLAFLHWVGIALHTWPFVSDIAIFVLKGGAKLQLTTARITKLDKGISWKPIYFGVKGIKCRLRESNPDMVTHPSTNRAQRRLTLLIETNALPLRQIATTVVFHAKLSQPVSLSLLLLRWPRLAESLKRSVAVWRPSVCPIGIFTLTHQGAACDAASVHFGPTIGRTDILVPGDSRSGCRSCRSRASTIS